MNIITYCIQKTNNRRQHFLEKFTWGKKKWRFCSYNPLNIQSSHLPHLTEGTYVNYENVSFNTNGRRYFQNTVISETVVCRLKDFISSKLKLAYVTPVLKKKVCFLYDLHLWPAPLCSLWNNTRVSRRFISPSSFLALPFFNVYKYHNIPTTVT